MCSRSCLGLLLPLWCMLLLLWSLLRLPLWLLHAAAAAMVALRLLLWLLLCSRWTDCGLPVTLHQARVTGRVPMPAMASHRLPAV